MSNQLEKILDKLARVKSTKDGFMSRCPYHNDKTASLTIKEEEDKILIHCFAGCNSKEIIESIGLTMSDLFINDEDKKEEYKMSTATALAEDIKIYKSVDQILNGFKTIDDYYLYNWEGEEPSTLQVRYLIKDKKSFATFHKMEDDQWTNGKAKGLSPLYNLDKVLSVKSVLIVEGEKLVKILEEYGIVATTSMGGAINAHNTDWTPLMKKPSVVFWRDYNDAGNKYQDSVANILFNIGVNLRKVEVEKLGLKEGDDLEQYIQNNPGTRDHVRGKIYSCIPSLKNSIQPSSHLKKYLDRVYNGEVDNLEIPGFPMLTEVGQFFIPGSITLVYSKPGRGKSLWTQNFFDEWSIGGKIRVKRLLLESSINMYLLRCLSKLSNRFDVLKTRFHKENREESKELIDQYVSLLDACGSTMTTSDSQFGKKITDWNETTVINWIKDNIKDNDVLLIDPISRILGSGKSPVWEVTNRITAEVESLLSQYPHARVVFIHHPNEEGGVSGGSGWERFSHNTAELIKTEEEELYEVVTVDGDLITIPLDRYIRIKKCRVGEGMDYKIGIKMSETSLQFTEVGRILRKIK